MRERIEIDWRRKLITLTRTISLFVLAAALIALLSIVS